MAEERQPEDFDALLAEGIAAARAGRRDGAREMLLRVVQVQEQNPKAWLWLSGVVDSLEDQQVCLENVLTLEPENAAARKGLDWVMKKIAQSAPAPEPPREPAFFPAPLAPAPAVERRVPLEATSAASTMQAARTWPAQTPALVEPEADDLENEWLCPFCAQPTQPEDQRCPACRHDLWTRVRRREKTSFWYWMALVVQGISLVQYGLVLALTVGMMSIWSDAIGSLGASSGPMGQYSRLMSDIPTEMLTAMPWILIAAAGLPFLYSLIVFIGLYLRWPVVYYLFLVNAIFSLVGAVGTIAFMSGVGLVVGGVGVLVALFTFFILFQMEDDFLFDRRRLITQIDKGVSGGWDYLARGRAYGRSGAWGVAALHMRRAVPLLPAEVEPMLALSVAYINLKRYDQALKMLEEARLLAPQHPELDRLEVVLTQRRRTNHADG